MASTLTFNGRLPGVVCETALPALPENPLRLDVAAFVGFAERGPVDTPTAVEDMGQYAALFGGDLLVARDGGRPVYANLPGAVAAFFNNGGRRCYVVRVVGEGARANRFRIPGLVAWYTDVGGFEDDGAVRPVIDAAASVGRWSDTMSVGTQLRSLPLSIAPLPDATTTWQERQELHLELPPTVTLMPGDLLRLSFDATGGPLVMCSVSSVQSQGPAIAAGRGTPVNVKIDATTALSFAQRPTGPLPSPTSIERRTSNGWETLTFTSAMLDELPSVDEGYALEISVAQIIGLGDLLHTTFADSRELFFAVTDSEPGLASPPPAAGETNLRLSCQQPLWYLSPVSVERLGEMGWESLSLPQSPVEVVQPLPPLEVQLGRAGEYRLHLPIGAAAQVGDVLRVTCDDGSVLLFPVERVDIVGTNVSASPPIDSPSQRLLSGMALWLLQQPSPASLAAAGQLIEVDLLSFDLIIRESDSLQEQWTDLRFNAGPGYWAQQLSDSSQLLRAPDDALGPGAAPFYLPLGMAILPGPDECRRPLPDGDILASPPEWFSHKDGLDTFDPVALFLDPRLKDVGVLDLISEANQYLYLNPDSSVEPLKKLHSLLEIEEVGLIALPDVVHRTWGPPEPLPDEVVNPPQPQPPDWSYFQDCAVPQPPPVPQQLCLLPFDITPVQDTEEPPDVRQQLTLLPVLLPAGAYSGDALLDVQKALVTLCAARADVVAVLSLPQHFGRREALDWQQALQARLLGEQVSADDLNMLSFTVVYHPWLQIPEAVTPELVPLRAMPPDGACCGMIAARELVRGPWIAPANVPLRGIVALTPDMSKADWAALFDARINLVRQLPGQFTLMSAHTLSYDNVLVQISVRRLLIFLRKLALRRGMRYVFESNTERFRRRVQASLENILNILVARGSIVAFEVVTDESINTQNDIDNGRFLIAIKVAPTLPIEFITVILLRTGEDLLNVIER